MRLTIWVLAMVAAAGVLAWSSRDLLPPRRLVFAAGPEGGGYHALAGRYRAILAHDDIAVEVLATAGSVENARLLSEGRAQAALLQGGVVPEGRVETLGAVFLEPLFVFARADGRADGDVPANPARWSGLTIAAGAEGSGARAAHRQLAEAAGVEPGANRLEPLGGRDAAEALIAGRVDVAVFVAPVAAPYLPALFASPDVALMRLDHVTTLSRRMAESTVIDLPSGAFSLDPPVPARDVPMLAMAAQLAARPDLHPSLVDRLVVAAREIHGRRDAISDDGAFPSTDYAALPADPYARDLIASGPSPLGRVLPYWVVAQLARFAILLVPVLFILVPLIRALPGLYVWRMRRRVFRHYATIRAIDEEAAGTHDPVRLEALTRRLDAIDREIAGLSLPLPYREFAYTARLHVDLIRKRLADRLSGHPPEGRPAPEHAPAPATRPCPG